MSFRVKYNNGYIGVVSDKVAAILEKKDPKSTGYAKKLGPVKEPVREEPPKADEGPKK